MGDRKDGWGTPKICRIATAYYDLFVKIYSTYLN